MVSIVTIFYMNSLTSHLSLLYHHFEILFLKCFSVIFSELESDLWLRDILAFGREECPCSNETHQESTDSFLVSFDTSLWLVEGSKRLILSLHSSGSTRIHHLSLDCLLVNNSLAHHWWSRNTRLRCEIHVLVLHFSILNYINPYFYFCIKQDTIRCVD